MVEDKLQKLHNDNSKIEFLTERLEWLDGYQNVLEIILMSEYLKKENIWISVIKPDLYCYGEDPNAYRDDELYASAYDKVVNELVSEYNKDGQLDFLKKLKDEVIAPIYLSQTTKWTDIEKGVQNRLIEVQVLQKKTDRLKQAIEKPVEQIEEEYIKECEQLLKDKKYTQSTFDKLMEISLKCKYKSLPQDTVKKYTFGNNDFENPSQNMKRYLSKKKITDVLDFKKKHPQFFIYRG